jgi:acyl-CoA synthetase (AMP-forming)/AMP-acid ligase II
MLQVLETSQTFKALRPLSAWTHKPFWLTPPLSPLHQATGLVPYRMVAVRDRTIPKTTSGKIRRRATREALHEGNLHVLHDSLGLLMPGRPGKVRLPCPA